MNIKNKVKEIQKNSIIIDAHFDLLMDVLRKRENGRINIIESDYLKKFKKGGINIIVSSIFIDNKFLPEQGLKRALLQISALYQEIKESNNKVILCKNYDDIMNTIKKDKIGILLSFEGVEPIGNDLNLLDIFYELGVRMAGITWSRRNYAADGCHFDKKVEGKKGGLTDFGVELIKKMEKMNMIIDVSHINDQGFWDIINFSKTPIIASHSNVRTLSSSMRNLTDEQIKAIAERDGVIGMNGNSIFISNSNPSIDTFIDHVDYIVNLVGIEHVGIGFDFCDMFRNENSKTFDVIKGHEDIGKFIEKLLEHGYNDKEIKLILGNNFLRVYKNILN
ncbi:peptidase [Tepiditoga spiralis]|uniref:Peptidase n=1 Tax=Tepiditoga spiralis TaxID=2108365 RepID=A0A7G1G7I5_9BACT|nr:dipeptidase [Tepiditoga spiralis]BBE29982.1 peptidase [Tepiditoga spiralis]